MYLKISYDESFDGLMLHLRSKYGRDLFNADGIGGDQLDINQFSKTFFTNSKNVCADVSVDANSNVDQKNTITYTVEAPKPIFRMNSYYLLWKKMRQLYGEVEANRVIEEQLVGEIYINDFQSYTIPYCFNFSTYDVYTSGLPFITKIKSVPPKHFYAFKSQLEQFIVFASNSVAGATGIADLLLTSAMYLKKILETKSDAHFKFATEEDIWTYFKESFISFIFTVNQPMRANQSPFTNISIYDKYFLDSLAANYFDREHKKVDIELVQKLQELFLDCMNNEMERTPMTFPVITACISTNDNGEIQDETFLKMICEKNLKFGFINIFHGKSSTLSSCCRLRSEVNNEYMNSFGGGSTKIGSLGVVTVNLPRLSYISKDKEDFKIKVREVVQDCGKINNCKRQILKKRIQTGFAPLYSYGFMDLNKQYSTVGLNGLNEAMEHLGFDILTEKGQKFALEIIKLINEENDKQQKQYKSPHNCEQVPGESSSVKLAQKDFILGYNTNLETKEIRYPLYSNQFLPLTKKADILDRIKIQGLLDKHFSGGSILHLNVGERILDINQMMDLVKTCAKKNVIYWAINYQLGRCEDNHMSASTSNLCEVCGKPIIEKYTRVVGFLVSIKCFNKTRRTVDFPNRYFYEDAHKGAVGLVEKVV